MFLKNRIFLFFFIISAVLTFLYLGINNFSFTSTNWLINYDNISDFLALKFFLDDSWRFPLGLNPNYGNITNSIAFSGAVPILSFIAKIFKNILPFNFHFFSIWIILCFFLQLFFSFKIIYFLTKNYNYSFIGSFFFLFSPTLIERIHYHLSLGAHWLILAVLYYEIQNNKKYINFQRVFLVSLSSLIHFYFTPMLYLIIIFFMFDKLFKDRNFYFFFKINLTILFFLIFTMYIAGYFVIPTIHSIGHGYGFYKANLLSFIDPQFFSDMNYSWSLLLRDIYNTWEEYEGFSYLGLGIIFIILFLFYSFNKIKFILKKKRKYFFIFFLFFLLSISSKINIGQHEIINLTLPNFCYALLSIFRASGRFIWPSYYIVILGSIFLLYKVNRNSYILFFFLLIQLTDFSAAIKNKFFSNNFSISDLNYKNDFISKFNTNEMSLKTTNITNESNIFIKASNILINENFKNTNLFRVGRYNREELSRLRTQQFLDFNNNTFSNKSIYIIDNIDHLRQLKFLFENSEHGFFFRDDLIFFIGNSKFLMNKHDHDSLSKIKFNSILKDNIKYIKLNDPEGFLGMGWSHNLDSRESSTAGSWSEGYSSSIFFNTYNSENIKLINLNIVSSITNNKDMLKLEFYLNNKPIKLLEIENKLNQIISLDTKNNLINGLNYLQVIIYNPITPVSKLETVDGRLLGFKLDSIELK